MGLQRVYLVLLALSIGAVLMGSFTLRWGVIEPKKKSKLASKETEASAAKATVATVVVATSAGAANPPAKSEGVADPFHARTPLLTIVESDSGGKKFLRVDEFFQSERSRRELGGEDGAALREFSKSITAAEAEELANRAIKIDLSNLDKEIAVEILAAAGGEVAVTALARVAQALIPPAAPEEVQEVDRRVREKASVALTTYSEGMPGAEEAKEALSRIRSRR